MREGNLYNDATTEEDTEPEEENEEAGEMLPPFKILFCKRYSCVNQVINYK